jgi:hypothetical protein
MDTARKLFKDDALVLSDMHHSLLLLRNEEKELSTTGRDQPRFINNIDNILCALLFADSVTEDGEGTLGDVQKRFASVQKPPGHGHQHHTRTRTKTTVPVPKPQDQKFEYVKFQLLSNVLMIICAIATVFVWSSASRVIDAKMDNVLCISATRERHMIEIEELQTRVDIGSAFQSPLRSGAVQLVNGVLSRRSVEYLDRMLTFGYHNINGEDNNLFWTVYDEIILTW